MSNILYDVFFVVVISIRNINQIINNYHKTEATDNDNYNTVVYDNNANAATAIR